MTLDIRPQDAPSGAVVHGLDLKRGLAPGPLQRSAPPG
jgi:hypothetical protein